MWRHVFAGRACLLLAAITFATAAESQASPDVARGGRIAASGTPNGGAPCMACHGPSGEGMAAFPRLASLGPGYLRRQLDAFADGSRNNPIMQPIAQALTPEQRGEVAAYYSSLPYALNATDREPGGVAEGGAWLATRGRWADELPACAQCHGPGGAGVESDFPPLAGQPAAYIAEQLKAWQSGARPPGPLGLMEVVARKLKEADIQAVSEYYAGLHKPSTAPAATVVSSTPEATRADAPPSPAGPVPAGGAADKRMFRPPAEESIPKNEYGKMIRLGLQIFTETGKYAAKFVGNDLNCVNCHLDAGRKPDAAPLWASFIHYPAFRSKTGQIDTLASRLQGCFEYSMNGKAPAADDEVITALQTYAFFLAKGAPVGMPVEGSGYPKLKEPGQAPDYARGEKVYGQNCAFCHGVDGQGQRAGDRQLFPALWGSRSFNWGAGMHQLNNAAGFIYANMPLGKPRSLTEQEAWDVALFMNSHERPQDPRFTGSVAETRTRYHDSPDSPYGMTVNGHLLGSAPAK